MLCVYMLIITYPKCGVYSFRHWNIYTHFTKSLKSKRLQLKEQWVTMASLPVLWALTIRVPETTETVKITTVHTYNASIISIGESQLAGRGTDVS